MTRHTPVTTAENSRIIHRISTATEQTPMTRKWPLTAVQCPVIRDDACLSRYSELWRRGALSVNAWHNLTDSDNKDYGLSTVIVTGVTSLSKTR